MRRAPRGGAPRLAAAAAALLLLLAAAPRAATQGPPSPALKPVAPAKRGVAPPKLPGTPSGKAQPAPQPAPGPAPPPPPKPAPPTPPPAVSPERVKQQQRAAAALAAAAAFFKAHVASRTLCREVTTDLAHGGKAQARARARTGPRRIVSSGMLWFGSVEDQSPQEFSIAVDTETSRTEYALQDGRRVAPGTTDDLVLRTCYQASLPPPPRRTHRGTDRPLCPPAPHSVRSRAPPAPFAARLSTGRVGGMSYPCDAQGAPLDNQAAPWAPRALLVEAVGEGQLKLIERPMTPYQEIPAPGGDLQPGQYELEATYRAAPAAAGTDGSPGSGGAPGGGGAPALTTKASYFRFDPAAGARPAGGPDTEEAFEWAPCAGGRAARPPPYELPPPPPLKWRPAADSPEYRFVMDHILNRTFAEPPAVLRVAGDRVQSNVSKAIIYYGLKRTRGGFFYYVNTSIAQTNRDLGPDGKPVGTPRRCQFAALSGGGATGACYASTPRGAPLILPPARGRPSFAAFAASMNATVAGTLALASRSQWPYADLFAKGGGTRPGAEATETVFQPLPPASGGGGGAARGGGGRVRRTERVRGYDVDPVALSEALSDDLPARVAVSEGRDLGGGGRGAYNLVYAPQRVPPLAFAKIAMAEAPAGQAANGKPLASVNEDEDATVCKVVLPGGRTLELPLLKVTGDRALQRDAADNLFIDIRKLQPSTGICTFDPGFTSTAACESSITYIDGGAGKLNYRGYPIEQLADKGDFFDAAYVLLHGELPTKIQKRKFEVEIKRHTLVHEQLIQFYKGFKHDAHPMAIMVGVVGALSAFYSSTSEVHDPRQQLRACMRLISKMPTLAALAYKTSRGMPIIYPRNDLSYAENLLYMMFASPCEPYKVDPIKAKALETILVLHMDHEQNASTSTVRTAGSSQANPFACVASGIAALWGPAHGGANEAVLNMLEEIARKERIPLFIARAKDKNDSFRLMGFGHRVYKTYDPRARIMKEICEQVLEQTGTINDPLLEIAMELEKIAVRDEYFVKRNLYPNVDFYSGIVLRALGIPVSMYTVIFAVARTVGWVSQWKEMVSEDSSKITRPRQVRRRPLPARRVHARRARRHLSAAATTAAAAAVATAAAKALAMEPHSNYNARLKASIAQLEQLAVSTQEQVSTLLAERRRLVARMRAAQLGAKTGEALAAAAALLSGGAAGAAQAAAAAAPWEEELSQLQAELEALETAGGGGGGSGGGGGAPSDLPATPYGPPIGARWSPEAVAALAETVDVSVAGIMASMARLVNATAPLVSRVRQGAPDAAAADARLRELATGYVEWAAALHLARGRDCTTGAAAGFKTQAVVFDPCSAAAAAPVPGGGSAAGGGGAVVAAALAQVEGAQAEAAPKPPPGHNLWMVKAGDPTQEQIDLALELVAGWRARTGRIMASHAGTLAAAAAAAAAPPGADAAEPGAQEELAEELRNLQLALDANYAVCLLACLTFSSPVQLAACTIAGTPWLSNVASLEEGLRELQAERDAEAAAAAAAGGSAAGGSAAGAGAAARADAAPAPPKWRRRRGGARGDGAAG
ncbi:MAG: hypothetical protein J3K34DRAFT_455912 [Monoraphidium minutum]|nr:MAG: hypothetical protein J3K34DRAFT_455912 [Monoraphidium minutum]